MVVAIEAVSSGSTGEPTIWPRFVSDELGTAFRFEQVFRDGFGAHQQIEYYVRCAGFTPAEALRSATSINARVLKLTRMGTVAATKEASFVVLNANPLERITNTRKIDNVYLRGVEVDRAMLRKQFLAGTK